MRAPHARTHPALINVAPGANTGIFIRSEFPLFCSRPGPVPQVTPGFYSISLSQASGDSRECNSLCSIFYITPASKRHPLISKGPVGLSPWVSIACSQGRKKMQIHLLRCNRWVPLMLISGIFMFSVLMNVKIRDPIYMLKHAEIKTVATNASTPEPTLSTTRHPLIPPYPFDYKFIINQPDKCQGNAPFLVILVIVNSKDSKSRHAIRSTWGNESNVPAVSIARLFLTGLAPGATEIDQQMLQNESMAFRDIIQQDFLDTYNNLTLKTMMGMEWVTKYCPGARYVMKIDCDMFLNVDFLVHNLLKPELPARRDYMSGYIVRNTGPLRSRAYKWYVPKEVYPKDIYPPYCSGPGYVFSGDIAAKIYSVAQTMQLINMEDSFIGLCMDKLKIKLTDPPGGVFNGHKIEYNRCRFASLITVHHYSPERLLEIWPDFQSRNKTNCENQKT